MSKNPKIDKIINSKAFWAVVSLVVAVLLWMYVTSTEGTEREEIYPGVKVEFVGEDVMRESRELVITNVENNTVTVRLRGNIRTMSKLDSQNIIAQVDLSNMTRTGLMQQSYTLVYPSGVDPNDITIVSEVPQVITFTVDRLSKKMIDVIGLFNGNAAEGYMTEPVEISPATVQISGPEAEISKVDHALVVIERENVDRTLTLEEDYILVDKDNNPVEYERIDLETETVTATLPILSTKKVALGVTLVAGGGATEKNCSVKIDPSSITLAGDAEILEGINKIDLGSIDLSTVDGDFEETFTIIIPNDTENLVGATEATVKLEIRGLETKKFTVTNFSCTNNTEGYSAEVITESLDVIIRAPGDVLDRIATNNIRVIANLAGYGDTTGIVYAPTRVVVDGFTEDVAGALNPQSIYVSLSANR